VALVKAWGRVTPRLFNGADALSAKKRGYTSAGKGKRMLAWGRGVNTLLIILRLGGGKPSSDWRGLTIGQRLPYCLPEVTETIVVEIVLSKSETTILISIII